MSITGQALRVEHQSLGAAAVVGTARDAHIELAAILGENLRVVFLVKTKLTFRIRIARMLIGTNLGAGKLKCIF